MTAPDSLVTDSLDRLLGERCTPQLVTAAEDGEWPAALWHELEQHGFPLAWVDEARGGSGASLVDGFAIARVAARHAVPLPLAETLLGGWLLDSARLAAPSGPMTVACSGAIELGADGKLRGRTAGVPFASNALHVVTVARDRDSTRVALLEREACALARGRNLAGEPYDTVHLNGAMPIAVGDHSDEDAGEALSRMGATLRAQQIAGALEHALAQSLEYAQAREQFGRPIAKFQAVQHNLAVLAGEAAAAGAAADAAADAISTWGTSDERTFLAVATAKIRAGEAAGAGAAIAHQVHGAMGFTREYSLQQRTRRLWSWRDEFGKEGTWAKRLGEHVAAAGADALWPSITAL